MVVACQQLLNKYEKTLGGRVFDTPKSRQNTNLMSLHRYNTSWMAIIGILRNFSPAFHFNNIHV